jgi:hypothetical protein
MKTIITISASLVILLAFCFATVSPASANGGPVPPTRVIPVTGNRLMTVLSGTANKFAMKDGDEVFIPALDTKNLKVSVVSESVKTLPADLPEEVNFLDALSVNLVKDGKAIDELPAKAEFALSFDKDSMLEDMDHTLAIFRWEGSKWVEVVANSLEAKASLPGLYVLVCR